MSIKYKEPVLEVIEELKCFFGDATDGLDACYREYRMFPGQTAHASGLPRHLLGRRRHALAGAGYWVPEGGAECAGAVVQVVTVELSSLGGCYSKAELRMRGIYLVRALMSIIDGM